MLNGQALSQTALRRLAQQLAIRNTANPTPLEEELKHIHKLYLQLGTLTAVGVKVGLTREAVRQKMERGHRLGLFSYTRLHVNESHRPFITRQELIADLMSLGSAKALARKWGIKSTYLCKVFAVFGIPPSERQALAIHSRKHRCHHDYASFCRHLGSDALHKDLLKSLSGRGLYNRIRLLWGRWKSFKMDHLNWKPRPAPRKISKQRRNRMESAFQKRMRELDTVRA